MPTHKFELRNPVVLDFETYYSDTCSAKSNMKKEWVGGPYHYCHHPDFYAYMLSYVDPITGECGVIDNRDEIPKFLSSVVGRTWVAHNALFETNVALVTGGARPFNTFDTADLSAYLQAPRDLAGASKYLLGMEVNKGMRDYAKGKHYHEMPSDMQKAMRDYALTDAKTEAAIFVKYQDSWPKLEQWISNFNRCHNEAGIHIDTDYLEEQIERVNKARSLALTKIPWMTDEDAKPQSVKELCRWCRENGIEPPASLAEDSDDCKAWEEKYGETYPVVGAIRDYRLANTFAKKLLKAQLLLRPDGSIPLDTLYFAANHTGRFSARSWNYMSLPRSSELVDLRGIIVPKPNHSFICSDLASIEARCLPWLAGDKDYLAEVGALDSAAVAAGAFSGGDLYDPTARRLFGYSDPRPVKKVDPDLRFAAKTCQLQLGFQSGGKKFHFYISNNVPAQVLDRVRQGTETDEALALRLVKLYRGMNPKVVNLWYSLDRELKSACIMGIPFQVQLPNSRTVNYYDLSMRESVDVNGKVRMEVVGAVCRGGELKKLYGGKISENITQEMARDVLCESVYNLAQGGFNTRFTVHDECAEEVPTELATPATCRDIEKIMCQTPEWAPGLPLACETSILNRYAK